MNLYERIISLVAVAMAAAGMLTLRAAEGETLVNRAITVSWPFTTGAAGQSATVSLPEYISTDYVSVGADLDYAGTKNVDGHVQTAFQPKSQASAAGDGNAVAFTFKVKTGLTFTPRKVSFRTYRHGTDGGKLDVAWSANAVKTTLGTGISPMRNNLDKSKTPDAVDFWAYTFIDSTAAKGECALVIYLYSLGNSKQVSYGDIVIEGVLNGKVADIPVYTLDTKVSPQGAGSISNMPKGTIFDENTVITLSQSRNFGYHFSYWADDKGNRLSEDETYTFTITKNTAITAQYETIPTWELSVAASDGAASYMVSLQPEPTLVSDKQMYEDGATVTLTASGNPIFTFSNWNNGETSGTTTVTMTADTCITASYKAVDFIAGWDFYKAGNSGRPADFASSGNDADALVLRNASGNAKSWLDKSQMAAGGYEGKPAAVNWNDIADKYYYQTKVNAEAFTAIHVEAEMLYNYVAYQTQCCEWSLDGTNWAETARITFGGAKKWTKIEATLPDSCNHAKALYFRWIPDYNSSKAGSGEKNDGTAITNIFVTGQAKPTDDGQDPAVVSQVPAEGADNASINGKIVLDFSEKIQLTAQAAATITDGKTSCETELQVVNTTLTATYKGLLYGQDYTFTLAANSVADLLGNTCKDVCTIHFTTKQRPAVAKGLYDFVVPDQGTFKQAIAKAAARTDKSKRFRIFVKQGSYLIPGDNGKVTGSDGNLYDSPITAISTPNVSIIGEGMDVTELYNKHDHFKLIEGLHKGDFIDFTSAAKNMYVQDISFRNGLHWGTDNQGDGRCPALVDEGDKNIFKNFKLVGWQDSYLSNNGNARFYFETSELHGAVDYLCGKGDIFYNECQLVIERNGVPLCAPSQPRKYGYVFLNCEVHSANPKYYINFNLGRPWGSGTPTAIYIGLTVGSDVQLSAEGWGEMSGGYPRRFAEYGTRTPSGTLLDLSQRKKTFGEGHANNPVLTLEEAAKYTVANVMGDGDNWDPAYYTEQASAPTNLTCRDTLLTWDNSDYARCWAIAKDGYIVAFTTEPFYVIGNNANAGTVWSVRAANEMGGLGEASQVTMPTLIHEIEAGSPVVATEYYTPAGIRISSPQEGVVIVRRLHSNGNVTVDKIGSR